MITTPSKNAFLSDEERRIRTLAYYGEFFANLDFDDGFTSIALHYLLTYISTIDKPNIVCTQDETSSMIKIIIESKKFEEETMSELFEITSKLQVVFCMTPIIQSCPFEMESDISVPVEVKMRESDGVRFHRQVIQKPQASILRMEKQLENLQFRINSLQWNNDSTVLALVETWTRLIPQMKTKIEEQKMLFQNLVAQKYIEMSSEEIWTKKKTSLEINSFQAEAYLDYISWEDKNSSGAILSWMKDSENILTDLRWQIKDLKETLIHTTNAIGEKKETKVKIEKGLLTDIKVKDAKFKSATILWTDVEIHHTGQEIIGFKLDGITKLLDIKNRRNNDRKVLSNFDAILPNDVVQHFYINENGKYIPLKIEGKKNFKSIDIDAYDKEHKPEYWSIQDTNGNFWYFYLEDWEYKLLEIENQKYFDDICIWNGYTSWMKDNKPTCGHIKNTEGNIKMFHRENDAYKFTSIEWVEEFTKVIEVEKWKYKSGVPICGYLSPLEWWESYFWQTDDWEYRFLNILGKKNFSGIIFGKTENNIPVYGRVTPYETKNYVWFYTDNKEVKTLSIEGMNEFSHINIHQKDWTTGKPKYWIVLDSENKTQSFYLDNDWYKFLEVDGEKSFDVVGFIKRAPDGKPLKGKVMHIPEKHNKKTRFNFQPSIIKQVFEKRK